MKKAAKKYKALHTVNSSNIILIAVYPMHFASGLHAIVFCCGLVVDLAHFTETGAIIRFTHWHFRECR